MAERTKPSVAQIPEWPAGHIHVADSDSGEFADSGRPSAPAGNKTMTWMAAVRDHPEGARYYKPLSLLALRLDWKTGTGYCYVEQLMADSGAEKSTVLRALARARSAGLLRQTRRGTGWAMARLSRRNGCCCSPCRVTSRSRNLKLSPARP